MHVELNQLMMLLSESEHNLFNSTESETLCHQQEIQKVPIFQNSMSSIPPVGELDNYQPLPLDPRSNHYLFHSSLFRIYLLPKVQQQFNYIINNYSFNNVLKHNITKKM